MIQIPTLSDLTARLKTNFANEFAESSPFTKNSFLGAILNSIGGEFYQYYLKIDYMLRQSFIVTADKDYLRLHGQSIIDDLPATVSRGNVLFTGVVGSVIPLGVNLSMPDNMLFITTSTATIVTEVLSPEWASSCDGVVTLVIPNHNLKDGEYSIASATNTIFNGTFDIAVTTKDNVVYRIDDQTTYTENPSTTAINLTVTRAVVEVESIETGKDKNVQVGTTMDLEITIGGVDESGYVLHNGMVGGDDEEGVEDYRKRLVLAIRSPRTPFSKAEITSIIKEEFRQVTRLFIREQFPAYNSITLYGMNDTNNVVLSVAELTLIRDRIREMRPINLPEVAIQYGLLQLNPVIIDLTNVVPKSAGLNNAIKTNLQRYADNLELGQNITVVNVNSIIIQTVDYGTGLRVETFDNGVIDTTIAEDEIAIFNISIL